MSHIEESQECIFHLYDNNNNMDFKIPLSSSASYEMETKFHVSSKFKVLTHTLLIIYTLRDIFWY